MESHGGGPFPLPQELLENIFRNLDIESVLSLRLTCRMFYAATTSIWLYFAREIHSRPENPCSEEPLEDYTSEELRRRVLRHHQAEQVWNGGFVAGFRMRKTKSIIREPIVLPGGRWFLSMNWRGEVMAVDMDSPQLEPQCLVRVNKYIEGTELEDRPGQFTVWVDPCAPRLTFRVALANPESLRMYFNNEGRSCVHIFQAHLLGHGSDATLISEPFRRFEGVFPGRAKLGVVNGRYFIQVKEIIGHWLGGAVDFDMYIFDCEKNISTRVRLCGVEYPTLADIFILSDDKVAIIGMQSIYIYSIPTSSDTSESNRHPIHTVSVEWAPPFTQRSEPYIGKTSTTIMYLMENDIIAFEMPHNIGMKQNLTRVAAFPNRYKEWRTVGLFDALDYQPQASSGRCFLSSLRYPWDPPSGEGPGDDKISNHKVGIPPDALPPQLHFSRAHSFHGNIGRLVMISSTQDLLYVYDLIPVGSSKAMDGGTA